jgi:hypothetical protein
LEAPEDIQCFQFSPTDPHVIAGGCVNGQVVMWDIKEYEDRIKNPRGDHRDKDLFIVRRDFSLTKKKLSSFSLVLKMKLFFKHHRFVIVLFQILNMVIPNLSPIFNGFPIIFKYEKLEIKFIDIRYLNFR